MAPVETCLAHGDAIDARQSSHVPPRNEKDAAAMGRLLDGASRDAGDGTRARPAPSD